MGLVYPTPCGFREGSIRAFETCQFQSLARHGEHTADRGIVPGYGYRIFTDDVVGSGAKKGGRTWSSAVRNDRSVFGRREKVRAPPRIYELFVEISLVYPKIMIYGSTDHL